MAQTGDAVTRPTLRGLLTTKAGLLAAALLAVEFAGGIQTYVTSTVTPLAAAELHGQALYGVAQAASQVGLFVTLPLGAFLASRFDRSRLLLIFTAVAVVGAVVGAAAPSMGWYAAGRGISGLAAGALATIAMNVVATGLPHEWRRLVLAGYAGMWVVTSLLGPIYASWVSAAVGWRWTMVVYLPLLIGARFLVARQLPAGESDTRGSKDRFPARASAGLAVGIALVATAGSGWWPSTALVAIGAGSVLVAAHGLLPAGTFRLRPGRPSAVAVLGILTSVYFGASAVIAIVGHDVFGIGAVGIGLLLTLGGLGWAVVGFVSGRRPSPGDRGFLRRVRFGGGLLALGLATIGVSPLVDEGPLSVAALFVGWAGSGAGMGLCYLELLSRIFDQPATGDDITQAQAAASAVMVEVITTALATTATAAAFAANSGETSVVAVFAALTAGAVLVVVLVRRCVADSV